MLCNADMEWWPTMIEFPVRNQQRLTGGYRPVAQETTVAGPRVTGRLPEGLDGTLCASARTRSGPWTAAGTTC